MFKVSRPKDTLFDLGKYVTLKLKEQRKSIRQVAKQCGCSRKWVYDLLERSDWKISYIMQFSELLKDDLTRFYRPGFVPELVPKHELDKAQQETEALQLKLKDCEQRLAETEKENQRLSTENKVFREVVEGRK